jgi:hypothetical protein
MRHHDSPQRTAGRGAARTVDDGLTPRLRPIRRHDDRASIYWLLIFAIADACERGGGTEAPLVREDKNDCRDQGAKPYE